MSIIKRLGYTKLTKKQKEQVLRLLNSFVPGPIEGCQRPEPPQDVPKPKRKRTVKPKSPKPKV